MQRRGPRQKLPGAFKNYGLQIHNTKKNDYYQIFMHYIIDFNAVISPLRLLRQR